MKHRVIDLLQSVPDGGELKVASATRVETVPFTEKLRRVQCSRFCSLKNCSLPNARVTPADCTRCYSQEIIEGELVSESGKRYPISGGIPRLLSDTAVEFVRKNRQSFSLEWKYFQFGERNWGQDIETRKDLFLKALGERPENLRGKLIFDAGCGSGLLSIEVANSFGMEVVALDLATGIEKAYGRNKNPYVHFIQGSVLEPPVKDGAVDYVYCAGVLMHLPDAKSGFNTLTRCVRPGGGYAIWLYHPLEYHRRTGDYVREVVYNWIRSRITSRMPIWLQEAFYLSLLPLYFLKRGVGRLFNRGREDRTWREKMQGWVDHFSPMYMNRFTEEEAAHWYRARDFEQVTTAYTEQYGFAMRGVRGFEEFEARILRAAAG